MSSKENIQEKLLVFGELEKSLLDTIIRANTKEGVDDLSSLSSEITSIENDDLTKNTRGVFRVLKDVASMMLTPESNNEPFQALIQMADGQRSALLCDFSVNDLEVLSTVFETISSPPLLARIGDVLWLCKKPKNPEHAKKAIDCYISQRIDYQAWHDNGKTEFHRAYQLARHINNSERISTIENLLKNALFSDDDIKISVAYLIDDLSILQEFHIEIASHLAESGEKLLLEDQPDFAVPFFELASKKYHQGSEESKYILMLVKVAECYAVNAEAKFSLGGGAKLISSTLFENAIHAYRKVPVKYREEHSIEQKISRLRHRLNEAGRYTLYKMGVIQTPLGGMDKVIKLSKEHVLGKISEFEAMIFFSGIYAPDYKKMREREEESLKNNLFSALFASVQYSNDGQIIAKTPAVGLDGNEALYEENLRDNMIRTFKSEIPVTVKFMIIPALQKILEEHTIGTRFIFEMCNRSPIIPKENVNLISRAIWLGFEFDFFTAVHLIAPQMEKIIRVLIKNQGGHTTNIDNDGIEHENGLSSLLAMKEAKVVLGEDVLFELKSVFSHPIGANLRNEVAHGLMTDAVVSSPSPVYAWWVLVRMVVHSLITPTRENSNNDDA